MCKQKMYRLNQKKNTTTTHSKKSYEEEEEGHAHHQFRELVSSVKQSNGETTSVNFNDSTLANDSVIGKLNQIIHLKQSPEAKRGKRIAPH